MSTNPYEKRTDASLADLLRKIKDNPRSWTAENKAQIFEEIAKRLDARSAD